MALAAAVVTVFEENNAQRSPARPYDRRVCPVPAPAG
jgi:hypothetical protein